MLEKYYNELCNRGSDIHEHLPVLKQYAEECDHVTEMGVRWITSTFAFLMGQPKTLISIDMEHPNSFGTRGKQNWDRLNQCVEASTTDFKFRQANTHMIEIEETDLLFIDTGHHYDCIREELELHGNKAKKYLVFHDTETFGVHGDIPGSIGIWPAIQEFLYANPHWQIKEKRTNNNGLTILERR
jgi:hypothetical protein